MSIPDPILHQRELSSLLPTLDFDVSITHFPSDLHQELNSNDVINCGGGVTLFEACSMGFPVLSFANEFHEEKNIDYFSSLNFCRFLGSIKDVDIKGIGGRLNAFLSDIELLNEMSNSAFNTVKDGTNNCVESICNIL